MLEQCSRWRFYLVRCEAGVALICFSDMFVPLLSTKTNAQVMSRRTFLLHCPFFAHFLTKRTLLGHRRRTCELPQKSWIRRVPPRGRPRFASEGRRSHPSPKPRRRITAKRKSFCRFFQGRPSLGPFLESCLVVPAWQSRLNVRVTIYR